MLRVGEKLVSLTSLFVRSLFLFVVDEVAMPVTSARAVELTLQGCALVARAAEVTLW